MPNLRFQSLLTASLLLAATTAVAGGTDVDSVEVFPSWSHVEYPFFPLSPPAVVQPVLTAADITDVNAFFVADPFLIKTDSLWLMFFEVTVPQGRIALATSLDGYEWKYRHIVLHESFHLSYPLVFQVDGVWYMTPESAARQSVRLYRGGPFPDRWIHIADLVTGRPFADPTVFRRDGKWWMFVGNQSSDMCWLYYSDSLEAGWTEHPQSPIVSGNRGRARPGGRVVTLAGGRTFRIAQNSSPTYGRAARAFEIDVLTTTQYAEHEIPESPLVQESGSGWNEDGMHQVDPWWTGTEWIAAVDGIQNGNWTIGIYRTASIPTDVLPGATARKMRAWPNPTRGGGAIFQWDASSSSRMTIYTASGRRVVERALPAGTTRFAWDGSDQEGRRLPAGVYFCEIESREGLASSRVVIAK